MIRVLRRRSVLHASLGAAALIPSLSHAQTALPDRALRILVGATAGGGSELMARTIASTLERRIGRRVTVQNRPNGPNIDAAGLFREDLEKGLMVAFMPTTALMAAAAAPFPFDGRSRIVPLTAAGPFQIGLAVASESEIKTFADYVTWAQNGPPFRRRVGVSESYPFLQIYARMIGKAIGQPIEVVTHAGTRELAGALNEGDVPVGIASVATLLMQRAARSLRVLAVSGATAPAILKNVPTFTALGHPDLELQDWYGFFASSASPAAVVAAWNHELELVLGDRDVIAAFARMGCDIEPCTPAEAATRFAANAEAWDRRIEMVGLPKSGD